MPRLIPNAKTAEKLLMALLTALLMEAVRRRYNKIGEQLGRSSRYIIFRQELLVIAASLGYALIPLLPIARYINESIISIYPTITQINFYSSIWYLLTIVAISEISISIIVYILLKKYISVMNKSAYRISRGAKTIKTKLSDRTRKLSDKTKNFFSRFSFSGLGGRKTSRAPKANGSTNATESKQPVPKSNIFTILKKVGVFIVPLPIFSRTVAQTAIINSETARNEPSDTEPGQHSSTKKDSKLFSGVRIVGGKIMSSPMVFVKRAGLAVRDISRVRNNLVDAEVGEGSPTKKSGKLFSGARKTGSKIAHLPAAFAKRVGVAVKGARNKKHDTSENAEDGD